MRNLRIVFMGTPDFAVTILKGLLDNGHKVVAVITAPDRPSGRGRKLNESAVKKYASYKNLPILQPTNLKNEDFIKELESYKANVQVVVAFRMLPKVVWNMPEYGTFNLHASLLPDYRGAAPIHWAIINGEKKTGVTTFFIDDKIDTGEIILQKETPIGEDETVGQLHDTLMHLGADLVNETIHLIANNTVTTYKQPDVEEKVAPKLYPENCKIDWTEDIHTIYNKIRGLNPFPAAWTILTNGDQEVTVKVYAVSKIEESHDFSLGKVVTSKKEIRIAVKGGYINVLEIKLSGKKKMDAVSLLNGFTFEKDAILS
ncbi:methionyl-tRNA formyltransferase [Flavobacteriaceae bacterium S356]|uniref:Methionyl-tRNA formyltransferase n=1 Tax=Asprobacillus argus TaxID=3076534 RepID=A0ABU3LEB3_9FLAO|nr:methionyl-tRNA formyltransferase [Flavobacteriaceae bacterium S356]